MQMNVVKFSILGCLALSLVSIAYADPVKETATVTVYNDSQNFSYSVFDYAVTGNASFSDKPDQIFPLKFITTNISLDPGSSAGLKFKALNNPECIIDPPKAHLGHCYELKFTNVSDTNPDSPVPEIQLWDNFKLSNEFTIAWDIPNNHIDVTVHADSGNP